MNRRENGQHELPYRIPRGVLAIVLLSVGCGTSAVRDPARPGQEPTDAAGNRVDVSRCEYEGRADREVAESMGINALKRSIRRVYRVVGQGEQRRRILVCREVDTNQDGLKDLVRTYDDQGEALEERADANYDGAIDTWIRYDKGRVVQVDIDAAWDGKPDVSRYYSSGKLMRIERDTNKDGKADVWEIYAKGHLERMGVDIDYDGRVDRWNRDMLLVRDAGKPAHDTSAIADTTDAPSEE